MLIFSLMNCIMLAVLLRCFKVERTVLIFTVSIYTCVLLLLSVLQIYHPLSLIAVYLILYLLMNGLFYIFSRKHYLAVIPNIIFVSSVNLHLILLSVFGLFQQMQLRELLYTKNQMIFGLLMFSDIVLKVMVIAKKETFKHLYHYRHYENFKEFVYYLWFTLILILVQAYMVQADSFPSHTSYFLIGNDLLLQILMLVFVSNVHALIKLSDVKKENTYLKHEEELRRKRTESLLEHADYDVLTKARSRRWILAYAQTLFSAGTPFSIVFIDLNRLKDINDEYGHSSGDRYLRYFTEEIQAFMNEGDYLGRIGGDEFLLVLLNETYSGAMRRMKGVKQFIRNPFNQNDDYFSFGAAENSADFTSVDAMIEAADHSMYLDKKKWVREHD